MTVRVYGAGMAGLLTAAMLRRWRPIVHEAQGELPNNHAALLRFRSDTVARETGQSFRRVLVHKAVKSGGRLRPTATIRDNNQYSAKVTGRYMNRSLINLEPCERWIAPERFIPELARDAVLKFGAPLTPQGLADMKRDGDYAIISTIPMPVLMKIVGWPNVPDFQWQPIWSRTVDLALPEVDVYQTIYYPDPDVHYYRASLTGKQLIIEYVMEPLSDADITHVLEDFGIEALKAYVNDTKRQEYGKLLPLADDTARQEFILAMTDEYNLYSVGRFATWRQILLDDVVQDVRRVETWIQQRNNYQRRLDLAKI